MTDKHEGVALLEERPTPPFLESRGAARAGGRGPGARLPHLRGDRGLPRGGRGDEGAGRASSTRTSSRTAWRSCPARSARRADRDRRRRRAAGRGRRSREIDLTVEPSLDSLRLYLRSIGRVDLLTADAGGRARQADRARRHGGQAADDRGEPAARRLDREGLPGPRAVVPRPDPGGLARADPRGREVRLPPRLQVLDLRHLVDPPGRHARDRRQGAHDPHPGAHGREAEQGRARRAPARAGVRPRADARGDRARARSGRRARSRTSCASRSCRSRSRSRSARRRTPSSATSSRTRRPSRRSSWPRRTCAARTCAGRSTPCPRASAR